MKQLTEHKASVVERNIDMICVQEYKYCKQELK